MSYMYILTIFLYLCLVTSSYGEETIVQTSNAPKSQNIVADTVNLSGLSQAQTNSIIQRLEYIEILIKKGVKSSEAARKEIEIIDKELSKIQREKFDSLPDDAKKWVREVKSEIETFKQRDLLIQESLKRQIEYREKLSQQMVVKIREMFLKVFRIIDSRILALKQEESLVISYTRSNDFMLFVERDSTIKPVVFGEIKFKNGSLVYIILKPGILVNGIAKHSPELQFYQLIHKKKLHQFSFKEKSPTGRIRIGPQPLIASLSTIRSFKDVIFDPHQEKLGVDIQKEFLSTFTKFIGTVIYNDGQLVNNNSMLGEPRH